MTGASGRTESREKHKLGEESWDGRRRSYGRQKRRRAQPATMPEAAGPPKPEAGFPVTTLQIEFVKLMSHQMESEYASAEWQATRNTHMTQFQKNTPKLWGFHPLHMRRRRDHEYATS